MSITLRSLMFFSTWSNSPVSPTPFALASARTSCLGMYLPPCSRSTSTQWLDAVSIRASLHREVLTSTSNPGHAFDDPTFVDPGALVLGLARFFPSRLASFLPSCVGSRSSSRFTCGRMDAARCRGLGAGSALNGDSVAGTNPSAPLGLSGLDGRALGLALDITRLCGFAVGDSTPLTPSSPRSSPTRFRCLLWC